MPNFESPIGGRNFNTSMREFEVPDESGYSQSHAHSTHRHPHIDENSIKNFQTRIEQIPVEQYSDAETRSNKNKLNDGAKRRIEMLIGLVQLTREVNIENNVFILRTLKSREIREVLMCVVQFDGTIQAPYEMKKQILARSLTHVAGIELDQFIGSASLDSKCAFIDELDDTLSSRLYDEYVKLSALAKEKYAINTSDDVKEVSEDLKKS